MKKRTYGFLQLTNDELEELGWYVRADGTYVVAEEHIIGLVKAHPRADHADDHNPEVTFWVNAHRSQRRDVGYTTTETAVVTLVGMTLAFIGVLAINSTLWPWLVTGFVLLPMIIFMGWIVITSMWLGIRISKWFSSWLDRRINSFLYNTRRAR